MNKIKEKTGESKVYDLVSEQDVEAKESEIFRVIERQAILQKHYKQLEQIKAQKVEELNQLRQKLKEKNDKILGKR